MRIIDRKYARGSSSEIPNGILVYWHVVHLDEPIKRIKDLDKKVQQPLVNRGKGFITASLIDPFGNILGIMHNPHPAEVRGSHDRRKVYTCIFAKSL